MGQAALHLPSECRPIFNGLVLLLVKGLIPDVPFVTAI
jgi:hypothetical protein